MSCSSAAADRRDRPIAVGRQVRRRRFDHAARGVDRGFHLARPRVARAAVALRENEIPDRPLLRRQGRQGRGYGAVVANIAGVELHPFAERPGRDAAADGRYTITVARQDLDRREAEPARTADDDGVRLRRS
jgi:hypothetical protein